jgi:enamine deaminase RidA (YjgF/YER057c/UK114 family)
MTPPPANERFVVHASACSADPRVELPAWKGEVLNNQRRNISSGTTWENRVGYSRAVRLANIIEVSGTTAIDEEGNLVGPNDPYRQTRFILSKIEKALADGGAALSDVVRTRMYVTDIGHWQEVGRAHGEVFGEIKPASTMVEVSALVDPAMLVEIEVTAILGDG